MSDDIVNNVKPVAFEWTNDSLTTGFIAQEVTSIDLCDAINSGVITIGSGFNGTSHTMIGQVLGQASASVTGPAAVVQGSSIKFTDPYAEMEERLAKLEKIIAEEEEVRSRCAAVKNAYDEYRLLLVLAKKNSGDMLTED